MGLGHFTGFRAVAGDVCCYLVAPNKRHGVGGGLSQLDAAQNGDALTTPTHWATVVVVVVLIALANAH